MGIVALYFLQVRDLGVQYASMEGMDCAFLFDTGKYIYALCYIGHILHVKLSRILTKLGTDNCCSAQ